MNAFALYMVPFFFTTAQFHSPRSLRDFKTNRTNFRNCLLQDTANGVGAGSVRNLEAKCHYRSKRNFYYKLSWSHPKPTGTSVTGYRIKISYEPSKYVCFQIPQSENTFVFNRSMGLLYGYGFKFYVTPQPVVRVNGMLYQYSMQVMGCPVPPKLLSLPNQVVRPGFNFSFIAAFEYEPIPYASIAWYFSSDFVHCRNRFQLEFFDRNIIISEDRSVLMIKNVSKNHVGCYVAVARNQIGHRSEQRGYLSLNTTLFTQRSLPQRSSHSIEKAILALLAGVMTILILILLIIKYKPQTRTENNDYNTKLITKTVYLSHCVEDKEERGILGQFSEALKQFGITVVVDIFSQVEIHSAGGLSRWIPEKMMNADKIIILLTRAYTSALKSIDERKELDAPSEFTKKIHTESVYVNSVLYNRIQNSMKDIIVVRKGIKKAEIPCVLKPEPSCNFPKLFDLTKDSDFRAIVDNLLSH